MSAEARALPLAGRVAVVTGSSRGLGRAMALAFARAGADVVVAARTEEEGRAPGTIHETAEEVRALGRRALPVRCDVGVPEEIDNLVARTKEVFGRADILVNNAAARFQAPLIETPPNRWDLMMRINLRAAYLTIYGFLPLMLEQGWGHIINVSPAARTELGPGAIAFNISKIGMTLLATGLSKEVAERNVAVNCLWPEGLRDTYSTRYFGTGRGQRVLSADVFADAAVHICSQEPRTFTGRVLTDLQVLREAGVTDFSRYEVQL